MKAEEKKLHINITWSVIKSGLLILASLLGKDGLIEKIKGLLDGEEDGEVQPLVDRCTEPKPTGPGSSPYGEWVCRNGSWVWIPDLGK